MIAVNVSENDLCSALALTNKHFGENIIFNRLPEALNFKGTRYSFTLKCKDSKGLGHRRGIKYTINVTYTKGRRLINACWHVHGVFFDSLFRVNSNAVIMVGKQAITKNRGNWIDKNIGNSVAQFNFSDACDCKENNPTIVMAVKI